MCVGAGMSEQRRVAGLLAVTLLMAVAGCGGDDAPSAADRRAAFERWAHRVDAVCVGTEQDIAARGAPIDVLDVDRVAVRAAADVRAAVDDIRALRTPPGAAGRVRPFLVELDRLKRHLAALTEVSGEGDTDGLIQAARVLEGVAERLHERARAAGLRECAAGAATPVVVWDAIVAPVFATEVAGFDRWFQRSVRRLATPLPRTPREAAVFYDRLAVFLGSARRRFRAMLPPERAADAAFDYDGVLRAAQTLSGDISAELSSGRPATRARARAIQRAFTRLDRRERAAMSRLIRETGARPLRVPPPEPDEGRQEPGVAA
jgi:hypothetical protein